MRGTWKKAKYRHLQKHRFRVGPVRDVNKVRGRAASESKVGEHVEKESLGSTAMDKALESFL